MSFFQDPPRLGNAFSTDRSLCDWLTAHLPAEVLDAIRPGLVQFGERVAGDIAAAAADAEANPPTLRSFDAWGRRIDRIDMAHGWYALHRIAAEEGIVATAYEHNEGAWSRVHQFARLYLFHPASALYSCPLAMTDGAATVIAAIAPDALRDRALPRLTSRDPERFWTSGQWMTERTGGSDVGRTQTLARRDGSDYRLWGVKWFSSAASADIALTLARPEGREGLSLFYLETRDGDGRLNGIRIDRLKDKLGTRAMPTAELTLDGARAQLLGEHGRGVRNIAGMLNVTRLYNAVCAIATMRRGLALAHDYARRREAFGRPLTEHPLHRMTLAGMFARLRGALHLVLHLGYLLGREECGEASDEQRLLLRLMTPVVKLYTGKLAVATISEVLECFGGAGYIEDTGLPRLLRDAQVLPIWEGTTNVLSLDVRRVMGTTAARQVLVDDLQRRMQRLDDPLVVAALREALVALREWPDDEVSARIQAMGLARTYAVCLMAAPASAATNRAALRLHCSRSLVGRPVDRETAQAARDMMCSP